MVILKSEDRVERGSAGGGGRYSYSDIIDTKKPYELADEAIRIADVNLNSKPCKAGNTTVVLGAGWPGSSCMKQLVMALKETSIEKNFKLF